MNKNFSIILFFVAGFSLSGCTEDDLSGNDSIVEEVNEPVISKSNEVVARVNGIEISNSQFKHAMHGAQSLNAKNGIDTKQQVLEKLIDQEIIVEKANKENLDRVPEVLVAIEAAKKEVLVKAYLQKLVEANTSVTDNDVHEYYRDNVALFSKRRIYKFEDISIEKNANSIALIEKYGATKKKQNSIISTLKRNNIKFANESYTKPAEQIPLNLLSKIQQMKVGEILVVDTDHEIRVMKLLNAEDAPISLENASNSIRSFLLTSLGNEIIGKTVESFRAHANVVYLGDFSTLAEANVGGDLRVASDDDITSFIRSNTRNVKSILN